jgi:hypothetical protein
VKTRLSLAAATLLMAGCATAIHERPNPSGGAPLTTFWTSSNADEIEFTSASGAHTVIRKLDNSTGPKEAIKVWGIIGLGDKATDILGRLGGQAIDTAGGGR